jgi:hypothetical protein
MKKILFFAVMLLLPVATNAQLALKVGLAGNVAVGNMSDFWDGGPGVDVNLKYLFAKHFGVGISTGYHHFFGDDGKKWDDEYVDYDDVGQGVVPIHLSFQYLIGQKRFQPYFGAELGVSRVETEYTFESVGGDGDYDHDYTNFSYGPVLGLYINFGDSKVGADISTRLNFIPSSSDYHKEKSFYAGLTLGLVFRFW